MNRIWGLISKLTAGRVYTRRAVDATAVYLTFDDGPHPEHTPRLLRLLARHDAHATFFLLGDRATRHQELVKTIVAAGHSLGNHSYTHPSFIDISMRRQLEEINRTERILEQLDGRCRHPFRPPSGRPTLGTIVLCLLRSHPMALWTHDSCDFALESGEVVEKLSGEQIAPGDILLFHDDGATGLDALEILLPHWRNKGLRFAAL